MKTAEAILFVIIASVFSYFSSLFSGFLQDDAYIFARYALNIADGNGFVFNIGERTEGTTSLLWTFMAAVAAKFDTNVPQFLKMASLCSSLLWLLAFFLLCKQWFHRPFQWVLPVVLFACFPTFSLWSQAGLETSFFGLLIVTGFYLLEEWRRKGKRRQFVALCIVSIALLLTRPESPAVIFLYVSYLFFCPNARYKHWLFSLYIPIVFVAFVSLLGLRYFYFHDIVPNTYYAKGGGGYYLIRLGLGKFRSFLTNNLMLIFVGLSLPTFFISNRIRILLTIIPIWILYFIKSGGDILPEHRLMLPIVPFLFLGAFFYLYHIRNSHFAHGKKNVIFTYMLYLGMALMLFFNYTYYKNNLSSYTDVLPALERAHGEVGRYLHTHMQPQDKAILTDAGMTSFYAQDKYIVDWLGLCDKRAANIFYETGYNEWALYYCYDDAERERRKEVCFAAMAKYFEELNPRYAVLNIYLDNTNEEMFEMIDFYENQPDTLSDLAINRISFNGYFGIFTQENRARNYKPVLIKPYNPYFWLLVVEGTNNKKPFEGKGFNLVPRKEERTDCYDKYSSFIIHPQVFY